MRFEVLEAIFYEFDRLLQKPGVATEFNVQSRTQLLTQWELCSPVILEDLPRNTLTRGLLGLETEVWEFVQLVAWPTDSMLEEVDATEI
jgi:hypothetical protein